MTAAAPASTFIYVIYVRTDAARLWEALLEPKWTRQYWFGMHHECSWQPGAPWSLVFGDGRIADSGEVLEVDAPHRLVLRWRNEFRPELKAEGFSHCRLEVEPQPGDAVRLTVTHILERPGSQFIAAVAVGWPRILSDLKSLLETGALALRA